MKYAAFEYRYLVIGMQGGIMKKHLLPFILATAASLNAGASTILYSASGVTGGVNVSASADFTLNGDNLTIVLTNTSGTNPLTDVPGSTLTGLFWNFNGSPVLTTVSAVLSAGSTIIGTCAPVSCVGVTDVSGEFGYKANSGPAGQKHGIASSGYIDNGGQNIGNFNNGGPGANLEGPASLDGINFGIVSNAAGYDPNGGLDQVPVISNSVTFNLTGVSGLTAADISGVIFQYGTDFREFRMPGEEDGGGGGGSNSVPEPGSLVLMGIGLLGLAFKGRRRSPR
jgi:hypothetical protein